MKKHRWFILALCFLLLNGYAVLRWLGGQRNREAVRITLAEPESFRAGEGTNNVVRWHFSADMVPVDRLGQWAGDGPVRFQPDVEGDFCWTAVDELSFRPASGWPACMIISAYVDNLSSLDGRMLTGDRSMTFETSPLALVDVRQGSLPSSGRLLLDIEFNAPVDIDAFRQALKLETAAGRVVNIRSVSTLPKNTFRVMLDLPPEDELTVRIRKGLRSPSGPLGLEQEAMRTVHISRELHLLQVSARSYPFQSGRLELMFNAPVDLDSVRESIRIEPELDFAVESTGIQSGRQNLRILADFQAGKSYVVTFMEGLGGVNDAQLEKDDVRTVYFPHLPPSLEFAAQGTYLSTQGRLYIPLKAVNTGTCSVKIRRIYANNLVHLAARESGRVGSYYSSANRGLDQPIAEFELPVDAAVNEIAECGLELQSRLEGRTGVFQIEIAGERGGRASHTVTVSDLGISLRQSGREMLVWINSIHSLDAAAGASVEVYSAENQLLLRGETDEEGLARLDPENMLTEGEPFLVIVQYGEDLTCMRLDNSRINPGGATGTRAYLESGYEAFLFTDRGIYRPGETIHLKAVVRGRDALCPEPFPLQLAVIRPDGKTDRTLDGMLGEFGAVEVDIPLAEFVATGRYLLQASLPGGETLLGTLPVSVEEFVPPQIRTALRLPEGRGKAGKPFEFGIESQYLFGRAAEGLTTSAQIDFMPVSFSPEGWSSYVFGDERRKFETIHRPAGRGALDVEGTAAFAVDTSPEWRPPAAIKALVSGTVQEPGGRTVTAYGSRILDVYACYIGIRQPDVSLETGQSHHFELAVVSPDGSLLPMNGALKTRLEKLNWVTVMREEGNTYAYRSEQQAVEMESGSVQVAAGRASVEFETGFPGIYRLIVERPEDEVASSVTFSVHAPGQYWNERSMTAPDRVELTLDRESYRVGDTARLSIGSPFPGKALLTLETDEILISRVIELTNNTAEVELPVEASCLPNAYCAVSVIRPALPEEIWGQHRAAGRIPLIVEQPERKLEIAMQLPDEIRPGTRLEIPLEVRDAAGAGCAVDVVLAAVDEGICTLTGFETPDPFDYFYGPRRPAMELYDLYARLMPESPGLLAGSPSAPGGGMLAAIGKRLNPVKAQRFKPVALWSSTIRTDEDGRAQIAFEVPEFTGELRIMAVAIDRARFGSVGLPLSVKRPLVVQVGLPRFLAPEDDMTMPVRIFNEAVQDGEVTLQVDCEGPLECSETERRFPLAAGSSTNIEFRLHAADLPGKAVCRVTASMGAERYEEAIEIAVRPAVPRKVYGGASKISAGAFLDIPIPGGWMQGTGEASVWLSSMPSVTLGGSLDYLLNYPYGCLEQTTSKSFPLLYLPDLAGQMRPGWLGEDGTTEFVDAGIYRILSMQRADGSFSLWPGGATYVWGSIYATHFLTEAAKAGYDVPDVRLNEALDYLDQWVRNAAFNEGDRDYVISYASLVLALGGRPQPGTVARLCEEWDEKAFDVRINLVTALLAAGQRRQAAERIDQLGRWPATPLHPESGGSLRSETRGNALLLSALLDVDPESDEIPVLARELESAQQNGCWRNTQENAMAIMALGKYTARFADMQRPISGLVAWNDLAKSVEFADRDELQVQLEAHDGKSVRIQNRGVGDLFFYWKSEGIPISGDVDEHDHRVRIRRVLLDQEGRQTDPAQLKQGELYIVQLRLWSDTTIENLVIEDLLPAGLEVENGILKTSQRINQTGKLPALPMQHLDIRDDRVIAFPGQFSGDRIYSYAVRAVTVGEFVWPAVSASSMYDPATESIHGKSRVKVSRE